MGTACCTAGRWLAALTWPHSPMTASLHPEVKPGSMPRSGPAPRSGRCSSKPRRLSEKTVTAAVSASAVSRRRTSRDIAGYGKRSPDKACAGMGRAGKAGAGRAGRGPISRWTVCQVRR